MLVLLSGLCSYAPSQAPIETRNHRALSLMFLRFLPAQEVLKPGQSEWALDYTNSNSFLALPEKGEVLLMEDYEISRLSIRFRDGFGHREEWFFELPVVIRDSGFMDRIIDWWHAHILGWPPQRRNGFPTGQTRLFRKGLYDLAGAFGLGDISVGYRRDFEPNVVIRIAVEIPTGNTLEFLGNGSVDAGISVDFGFTLASQWYAAIQAALIIQGRSERLGGVHSIADQEGVALIWKPNSRDEWIAQWQSERAPIATGFDWADSAHRLFTLGYRRKQSQSRTMQLYFSEDSDILNRNSPLLGNAGPDFTFGLSLSVKR